MELVVEDFRATVGTFDVTVPHFEVEAGTIGCVLGRSGSGKTTFLHGLAGFIPVQDGTRILRGGKETQGLPPEKRNA